MKTSLGELEKKVMDIVWEKKSCSVREVVTNLQPEKKLAYTTVATIIHRLYEKGLLKRSEEGLGYIYSPRLSKAAYSKSIARNFLNKFINSFGDEAISSFAESIDSLPPKKRSHFLKLLEDHDKGK